MIKKRKPQALLCQLACIAGLGAIYLAQAEPARLHEPLLPTEPLAVLNAHAAAWNDDARLTLSAEALAEWGKHRVDGEIQFNRDIRPILVRSCFVCHGADKAALAKTGNMKLDTFEGATEDRGGYSAIVPGKPDESWIMKRLEPEAPELRMPPPMADVPPLSKDEIALLRRWIAEGAKYEKHWAFIPPSMPDIPKARDANWRKNPIDGFIDKGLAKAGLKPEKQADKSTLLRRATFAVTGLPPTVKELNAFLADKRSDAYERAVDRLLDSPRFGENQARYWLDAVRYADTHGLHIDNERAVFPYRDWIVRAYNQDLPYDEFLTWQLAGDLLPDPTTEELIATGYVRMNPTTNEGGVIEAEFLAKNTFDRVDTTSTVFMGLTLGCAKCHDHKYDPLSMKDYYSMYAFFDSTADAPLDGNLKLHQPVMKAPTPEQDKQLKSLQALMDNIEAATPVQQARDWALANAPELPSAQAWEYAGPYTANDFDAAFDTEFQPEKPDPGAEVKWQKRDFRLDANFTPVIGKDNASGYVRATLKTREAGTVEARLSSDDGVKLWVNGKLIHQNKIFRALNQSVDTVKVPLQAGENRLLIKIVNGGGGDGFTLSFGDAAARRLSRLNELASKGGLSTEERKELLMGYLELGPASANAKAYRERLAAYRKLDAEVPFTYVAKEMDPPRKTFVLKRGAYDQPGDPVDRAIPSVFGGLPSKAPKNRLGLAAWLTRPDNPLTSRVFVNRVWQQHFGTGIVRSSEDFGTRGDWPTNPELLDYLATRFVKDGWSLKKLTKLILTSETFKQASTVSKAKLAKDPENLLLSRGPRFRLDAEVIRDSALYVGGLLVEDPGGRGDMPYQPSGLWEIIAYPISDTARYVQDHGEALYRRSLYMFWKRTSPPPTMLLFDAPMRESCVVRRSRTNTPTQALATMNETGFFEAARSFAAMVMQMKKDDEARLSFAFRCAVSREPTPQEAKVLNAYLQAERRAFAKNPQGALNALTVGEMPRNTNLPLIDHAAWLMVCNLILNLDETLTQH